MNEIATRLLASGLSVIPIKTDGSKAPLTEWKPFQKQRATAAQARGMWSQPAGIAVIGGAVSGNQETLDFDRPGVFETFAGIAEDNGFGQLVRRLPLAQTPSNGRHCYYRSEQEVDKNLKLARDTNGKTLIETRGEGGYAIIPPSPAACHPDGKPYMMLRGDLAELPVLTQAEVTALHRLARACNEFDEPQGTAAGSRPQPSKPRDPAVRRRPGDDYNERGQDHMLNLLQQHGWKVQKRYDGYDLTRPGKEKRDGLSATFDKPEAPGLFYVFSSNAQPFEENRGYPPFTVYALLEHNRDFKAAACALAAEGYGDPLPEEPTATTQRQPGAAARKEGKAQSASAPTTPGEVLTHAGKKLDAGLKKYGVVLNTCALQFPDRIDQEGFISIGKILKRAGRRFATLTNFLLADWYAALPSGRGQKKRILLTIFGDDHLRRQQMMSDWQRTAREIPPEYRNPERAWAFYEAVAKLPEERRLHWLKSAPQAGETQVILLELEALKPHDSLPQNPHDEIENDLGNFGNSKRLTVVNPLPQYDGNTIRVAKREEHPPAIQPQSVALTLPIALAADFQECATATGKTTTDFLALLLNLFRGGSPEPEWFPTDDDAPPSDEDDDGPVFSEPEDGPLVLQAMPEQVAEAHVIARKRKEAHDGRRKAGEDRGSDAANLAADRWGVLAEIMIRDRLCSEEIEFRAAPLFADRVDDAPDLTIGLQQYDIKAVPPDRGFFCVNDAKHQRHKGISAGYLAVLFDSPTEAHVKFVPHDTVDEWERRVKHGREAAAYRSIHRKDLRPISTLSDLRSLMEQPLKTRPPEASLLAMYG